jgi:tetratricopeptide (TPR) repeat protein
MKPLKQILCLALLLFAMGSKMYALSLEDAFYQSYGLEKDARYADAANTLKQVYEEKSYELNLRLGYLCYMAKDYVSSESYYEKAVNLKPFAIEAKMGWVLPLSVANKWDKIVDIYNDILKIDPQNSAVNYRMGVINYNKGNYKEAVKYMDKVVSMYPFNYDGLLMQAWIKLKLNETEEAKSLFNKVLLLSPGDKSAKDGLALIK